MTRCFEAIAQLLGDCFEERPAIGGRERRGGAHDGVELAVGEGDGGRHW